MKNQRGKHRSRHRPLTFRAWEAVGKLKADLAYRTPRGFPQKHIVLRRDLGMALLRTIERHYDRSGKPR
jgi:hypothetical protein